MALTRAREDSKEPKTDTPDRTNPVHPNLNQPVRSLDKRNPKSGKPRPKDGADDTVSYLGHLSQAPGVGVFVEENLVGHLLPDLSLGPLLLSPDKNIRSKQDTRERERER